jgi:hypothetical protein
MTATATTAIERLDVVGQYRSPVLVTGAHRSGTTWVGKVLASAPGTVHLQEPFHVTFPNPYIGVRMKRWFQFYSNDGDSPAKQAFRDAFSLRLRTPPFEWRQLKKPRAFAGQYRFVLRSGLLRWRNNYRVVMKDPIALLSTPWLVRNFGVRPIVLVRHPAAFVSSLRIKNWFFDYHNLLDQPGLINELFPEERPHIEEVARRQFGDIIPEAAYLWKLLNLVVAQFRRDHPDWIILKHEDLSSNPAEEFRNLFTRVGLPFTPASAASVRNTTSREDERYVQCSTDPLDVTRNSVENVAVWKKRLTAEEVARIRAVVEDVSHEFYSDGEWR